MLITSYTSIKPIVERVYADTGYQFEIPHDDLILWTVEGMELIGYPLTYVPKIYGYNNDPDYNFTDFRVPLPCDFHKLQAVSVDGFPAYYRSDSFHNLLDGKCCGFDNVSPSILNEFTTMAGTFSPQAEPLQAGSAYNRIVTFDINNSYITFNIQSGKVCLAYWAFPVDKDGFPVIPEDAKYKRAIQDYLIYKVDYKLWRQGYIPENIYRDSENRWLWSVGSASSHLKMPSVDQMELLKTSLISLIPKFHSYSTFFKDLASNRSRL